MLNSEGFDLWADGYDKSVNLSEENGEYPFAGYRDILGEIYRRVMERGGGDVLDIGFGTGVLTSRLYAAGCRVAGVDFSEKMIAHAKAKMPEALLVRCDFSKALPEEITRRRFDFIISTYAFHHLRDGAKPDFLRGLSTLLKPGGEILIGDVSFETRRELEACREKYRDIWDSDEEYFVAEELQKTLAEGIACDYRKMSYCAGILCARVK